MASGSLIRKHTCKTIVVLLHLLFTTTNADILNTCRCVSSGLASFRGVCADSELMVVKRAIIGRTKDNPSADFCSRPIVMSNRRDDCFHLDPTINWRVTSACNMKSSMCQLDVSNKDYFNPCASSTNTKAYACLEYDCISKYDEVGMETPHVVLSTGGRQVYNVSARYQIMTSSYPSASNFRESKCSIMTEARTSVLFRLQDVRSRYMPGQLTVGDGCPYKLYVRAGQDYKQWCARPTWHYDEMRINSTSVSRTIDIVYYSDFSKRAEGAAWITVEASNGQGTVICGNDTRSLSTSTTTTLPTTSSTSTVDVPTQPGTTTQTRRQSTSTSSAFVPTTITIVKQSENSTTDTTRVSEMPSRSSPNGMITATTKRVTGSSLTPGVPPRSTTPGVPISTARPVAQAPVSSDPPSPTSLVIPVAIGVAVSLVVLILLVAIIMAIVWRVRWRKQKE